MLKVLDRGVIFDATNRPKDRRIAFFTSLLPLRSGAILCGFQNGPAKQAATSTVRVCRSNDAGRSWNELPFEFETSFGGVAGSPCCAEFVEPSPGRILLFASWFDRSEPDRPLFDPQTEGILRSKVLICESNDQGDSWTKFREISIPRLTGYAMCGPPLLFADGTIAYSMESFKEFDDPSPPRHAAWLLLSRDGGATFDRRVLVAQHPKDEIYYWDQRVCLGESAGDFYALYWTHDRQHKRDLNVHLLRGSIDAGDRCEPLPVETTIPGQIAAPLLLPDGRLLAFVVDRERPGTMKLWVSSDRGQTWPETEAIVVHTHEELGKVTQGRENIDFAQYWEDMRKWSFGHPALRLLPDGAILLAWYAGTPDAMSIHWARVQA